MANLATRVGTEGVTNLRIHTPLIDLSKADIVRKGHELGVDYGLTSTRYAPDEQGYACGACDACILRLKGFADAGVRDPIAYQRKDQ